MVWVSMSLLSWMTLSWQKQLGGISIILMSSRSKCLKAYTFLRANSLMLWKIIEFLGVGTETTTFSELISSSVCFKTIAETNPTTTIRNMIWKDKQLSSEIPFFWVLSRLLQLLFIYNFSYVWSKFAYTTDNEHYE